MHSDVAVTLERVIGAEPAAVWRVVTDPAVQERLGNGVRLDSRAGEAGTVGSSYVLEVSAGRSGTVRLQHDVVMAEPDARLVVQVSLRGQRYGEQRAELIADPAGSTLLRWTTVLSVGPVAARVVADAVAERLGPWLEAVEREVLAD